MEMREENLDIDDEYQPVTIEKYLELLNNNNLKEAFEMRDGDESFQFTHKWIAIKTFLTFNTFLYGFP